MAEALLWGIVGSSSLLLGALVARARPPGTQLLGLVMGFGAGVLLSAVSFELVEEAVETAGGLGGTATGFFAGAVVFFLGDLAISRAGYRHRKDISGAPPDAGPFAIVLGTILDGVPESAVLGLTIVQSGEVGVSMLVAVFVSNTPEAIAATTSLRASGWSDLAIFGLWTGIVIACGLSAVAGFAFLDGAAPSTVAFMFAFAGGAILTMVSTSMMPEAYEHAGRPVGLATTLGFAVAYAVNWIG